MTQYYIGTSGWNYDDWRGTFYPKKLAASHWLAYYVKHFNALEINSTFYRFFKDEIFCKWYAEAPKDFHFVLKAPRLITHIKLLKNTSDSIARFEQSALLLKEKLGLILLQLSPRLPYDLPRLETALQAFKNTQRVAVEFRHLRWYTKESELLLSKYKSTVCLVDSHLFQLTNTVTSPIAYVRLHGRVAGYHYDYTFKELKEIAKLIKDLSERVQTIYIFFNNDYHANAPRNAETLRELLV